MPESAIQVAAGTGLDSYYTATRRPYSDLVGQVIERVLPFTQVIKCFTGGKYPTYLNYVPPSAEYVVQATEDCPARYFPWLKPDTPETYELSEEGMIESLTNCGNSRRNLIYTSHGTIVYVDENTWELRHGSISQSPVNLWLVGNSKFGEIRFIADDVRHSVFFTATHSRLVDNCDDPKTPRFFFELVDMEEGRVGLKSGSRFLSAGSDGTILLDKAQCLGWEMFRLSQGGLR
jgi:hypothetical protein